MQGTRPPLSRRDPRSPTEGDDASCPRRRQVVTPRGDVQMFGAGLSKRPVRRPRTTCGASRRSRRTPLMAAVALGLGSLAVTPPATAGNVTSAAFSGGTGTYTAGSTLYAKQ